MADLTGFDASNHTPKPFDCVPPGWYVCVATESTLKDTKAGDGTYFEFIFEIQNEGPQKGRKLFGRINRTNAKSSRAEEIGEDQLAALCQAVGVLRPSCTEDLHEKLVEVKVVNRKWENEMQAEVKAFRPVPGSAPAGSVAAAKQDAGAPAGEAKKPW